MISNIEFKRWAATLDDDNCVAVDDGGLTLVELGEGNVPTGAYHEIGGIPLEEEEPELGWGSRPEVEGKHRIYCPGHEWHGTEVAYQLVPCVDSADYLIRIEDPAGRWEDAGYENSLEEAQDAVAEVALQYYTQ